MNDDDAPDTTITTCANCGKGEESSGDLKACTACKLVKYCNRECQIAHRPLHKKACKKRAAELHDEALFREHPPPEDCPICFQTLPYEPGQATFELCCGKIICQGCIYAMTKEARQRGLCAFCRAPPATSDAERVKQIKKLMDANNAYAFYNFAGWYARGLRGYHKTLKSLTSYCLKRGSLDVPRDIATWDFPIEMAMVSINIPRKVFISMSLQL